MVELVYRSKEVVCVWKEGFKERLLKFAGFLELIAGAIAIIMVCSVLVHDRMDVVIGGFVVDKNSILSLILIFLIAILQIVGGLLAIGYAKGHNTNFCFIVGLILLFLQALTLNKVDRSVEAFVIDLISIGIPSFYLYAVIQCKNNH